MKLGPWGQDGQLSAIFKASAMRCVKAVQAGIPPGSAPPPPHAHPPLGIESDEPAACRIDQK